MKKWFLALKIRLKLLLAFGSILLMSVLLIGVGITTILRILSYNQLVENVNRMNIQALKLNSHVKEFSTKGFKDERFLSNNNSLLLQTFDADYKQLMDLRNQVDSHEFFEKKENKIQLDSLSKNLLAYNDLFKDLVAVYTERGFKDYGVEGTLRASIHDVEESAFPYDRAIMLTLRRHEKDFFLRKDLKYLDKFNATIQNFKSSVDTTNLVDQSLKASTLSSIENYKSKFNYIVELEKKIGLESDAGLLGSIAINYEHIERQLSGLTDNINARNDSLVSSSLILLTSLFLVQLILGLFMVVFYSSVLTKAIKEIKNAIVMLSDGEFPKKLAIRTMDEIAQTKRSLNQLVDRIRSAVNFANNLGKGNLKADYDDEYREDVLAKAILKMQQQLIDANEQQAVINWTNEGMARFSEILKNESENLEKLADDIIRQMAQYLKLNQGALYLLNENKEELTRLATYAYGKKRFVDHKLNVGQGLVGQCVLEASTIHVKDVPKDFVKITSGLGEATPTNLLIIPLKIREQVMGVIELASFQPFSETIIKFTEKVSENIANILYNKQRAEITQKLLSESQEKAQTLAAQEEELRQNSEELQATQEDMERQKNELDKRIAELEQLLSQKEEEYKELKKELIRNNQLLQREFSS